MLSTGEAVTVDALVEGVHWDARLSAEDVGYKAIAASVSDLGAMGATPRWAVLALCLPAPLDHAWVAGFARGVAAACARWDVDLVGGDTTRSPGPRVVSATLGGPCPRPARRDGAGPGDALFVTGWLGLAGAGWMQADPPGVALAALRRPDPPVAFGVAVAAAGLASAMMDLSDGLARDLPRLCAASGVGAEVEAARLPVHPVCARGGAAACLVGGEDYELLLAAPPSRAEALLALAAAHGVRLTEIGRCTVGAGPRLDGGAWPSAAFEHFEEGA